MARVGPSFLDFLFWVFSGKTWHPLAVATVFLVLVLALQLWSALVWPAAFYCLNTGHPALAQTLAGLMVARAKRSALQRIIAIYAAADVGRTEAAVTLAEAPIDATPRRWWSAALVVVSNTDTLVNAGRYRAALGQLRRIPRRTLRRRVPSLYALIQVNRAEALHNLGRDRLALRLLARMRPLMTRPAVPLVRNGALCLEAWILAHVGDIEGAQACVSALDPRPLARRYAAEVHFARAAVEFGAGRLDAALQEATSGQDRARRASSQRNALFLLGTIEAARGETMRALEYLERGRKHVYKGQAAPGLARLGALYEDLGRVADAESVYLEAFSSDPESYAAPLARERHEALRQRLEPD